MTAVRELEKDTEESLLAAEAELANVLQPSVDVHDTGIHFLDDPEATLRFLERQRDSFPTGIPALDQHGLGPVRRSLLLFVAPPGSGKTWFLVNLATRAYQHAKKVLFISLEMEEDEISQRLIQSFFSMSKREVPEIVYRKFAEGGDRKDWGTEWSEVKLTKIANLADADIRKKLLRKIKAHRGGERVIIKGFPIGTLSPKSLEATLDILEQRESFVPDLLLIDYADIMKLPSKRDRWEGIVEVITDIKRIGQERDLAGVSASQTKISGATAKRVDQHHTGGAWDKVARADTIFTYSQTMEERRDNLARIFVAKGRAEQARFEVMISQCYDIGQFVLSSTRLGSNYYDKQE